MKTDLEKAKAMLRDSDFTCVLCKEELVYTSKERGVKPLLEWRKQGISLKGFSAADKVVGKATAFLYVLAKVQAVYAPVMSDAAMEVLKEYGIEVICDTAVPAIRNRSNTGFCPMEQAVADSRRPEEALTAILNKLKQLQ